MIKTRNRPLGFRRYSDHGGRNSGTGDGGWVGIAAANFDAALLTSFIIGAIKVSPSPYHRPDLSITRI